MKIQVKLNSIRKRTPREVKLMIDHSFAIVDRIHGIMTIKKISQRGLAEMLGKKESEVSKWMRGTHNFTLKTIARLEAVLGEPILHFSRSKAGASGLPPAGKGSAILKTIGDPYPGL